MLAYEDCLFSLLRRAYSNPYPLLCAQLGLPHHPCRRRRRATFLFLERFHVFGVELRELGVQRPEVVRAVLGQGAAGDGGGVHDGRVARDLIGGFVDAVGDVGNVGEVGLEATHASKREGWSVPGGQLVGRRSGGNRWMKGVHLVKGMEIQSGTGTGTVSER